MSIRIDSIAEAVDQLRRGRPVVVLDSPDRENEGDLVMPAEAATTEWIALFARHGSGFICAPMPCERADALGLPLMVARNEESLQTAFTITVDAKHGVSTGISAADRAHTLRLLADPSTRPTDLVRPGHVLPLRAHPGGVQARPGHTEAAVALTRMAGRGEVGIIVELVEDDGSMKRAPSCRAFADEHGLCLVTIADLRAHLEHGSDHPRQASPQPATATIPDSHHVTNPPRPTRVDQQERTLTHVASTRLPTRSGLFTAHGYRDGMGVEHIALVAGSPDGSEPALVRVHSECLTGDVLGSLRCDCGPQLQASLELIGHHGRGVVVYLRGHEGRGIGLASKLAAYALQDGGRDTVDANLDLGLPVDSRDYGTAAQILEDLGVQRVRLLTNNPEKVDALRRHGLTVTERVPLVVGASAENEGYLDAKRRRLGHHLPPAPELSGHDHDALHEGALR
ncbi:MAG: GTP cyclohydrolase II [Actinomycetales bacterium]